MPLVTGGEVFLRERSLPPASGNLIIIYYCVDNNFLVAGGMKLPANGISHG